MKADARQMGHHEIAMFLLTGALLSIGAIVGVVWVAGVSASARALADAHWKFVFIAPIGVAISHVGYMFAYREVARVGGGPDLGRRDTAALVATGFGPFNPRGGFALDACHFGDSSSDDPAATLRVLVLGILEYAILAPATWAAALLMMLEHQKAQVGLLPSWVIGVPVGAAVTLVVALLRWRSRRRGGRPRAVDRGLHAIGTTLSMLRSWPGGTIGWFGMAVYWAGEIAALGGCLAIFGTRHVPTVAVIVAYATGYAMTRRTLPLAGAGAVEAFMPFALTWVSYPLASAVLAVIVYRIFNLWMTMIPAAAGLRRLRRTGRQAEPDRADHPALAA